MRAICSAQFSNSIGICSHLNWKEWRDLADRWIPLFRKTGVRHTRSQIGRGAIGKAALATLERMEAQCSVTVDPVVAPTFYDYASMEETIALLAASPHLVADIAGPNEPNNPDLRRVAGWLQRLVAYQQALYGKVKGTPTLAAKPVLWPSPWAKRMVDFEKGIAKLDAASDGCNAHYYCGARRFTIAGYPAGSGGNENGEGDYTLDQFLADHRRQKPVGRFRVTEYGYDHECAGNPISRWVPPEEVSAAYLLRAPCELFLRGVDRGDIYSLIDDDRPDPHAHGLLDRNLNPRLAYHALCNLMALLDDPLLLNTFETGDLEFLIDGPATSSLPLMQRADGTFLKIFWQDADLFDVQTLQEVTPMPIVNRLDFAGPMNSIRVYRPTFSAEPVQECRGASNVEIAVEGQLTVVAVNI